MKKLLFGLIFVCALACANNSATLAEFNPQQVVTAFRNLNVTNTGFDFTSNPVWVNSDGDGGNAYRTFVARNGSALPNTSAYGGVALLPNGFRSYCVDVAIQRTTVTGTATLNYNPANGTTSNYTGHVLSVGAAWLHSQYARGILPGYDETVFYEGDSVEQFYAALTALMSGTASQKLSFIANSSNMFAVEMRNVGSMYGYTAADWAAAYDMRGRYDAIGDYAVFVMSIRGTDGRNYQDFLYLAPADYGNGGGEVPEPATLLLWTLGGMGLAGSSWARKRRKN